MAQAIKETPVAETQVGVQRFLQALRGRWLVRILFLVLLVVIWELLFNAHIWSDIIVPGPLEVLHSLVTGFRPTDTSSLPAIWNSSLYLQGTLVSLARLGIGYAISLVIGVILGLLMGRINLIKETVGSLVLGLQALPSICWLPFAILWFGLTEQAIIFVVVMGALFSITLGVESGVRNTPPIYLKAARNMGSHGLSLYTQVILPAALPAVINGLKQGWTFAWRSLMAAELIYTTISLGNLLYSGEQLLDSSMVISVMLLIIVVGVAIDVLVFGPLEKLTRARWGLSG